MDGDFQAHYLTAEQAYGAGDFRQAQSIVIELLSQLDGMAANNAEQDALLAWRAFVALLAGNIHLYGLNEPEQACGFYELVLASHPQETLKDLAEQGLERIQERQGDTTEVVALPAAPESPPVSTLIQDPFVTQATSNGFTGGLDTQQGTTQASATPWLDGPSTTETDPTTTQAQTPLTTAPVAINEEVAEEEEVANAVAEADAEPSSAIELQVPPEPNDVIEADVIPEPETVHEPEQPPEPAPALLVSPSVRHRLEQGRLEVILPHQQKPPSELSSDSGKDSRN